MKLTGSQIFVEVLVEQGVDTLFGYPGGAVLNLYDELYKNSDRIRHVLTAHEQGASHAADGYARATGRTGVVLATSGPGATNLVTGIATAYMDSVPMVAFTGNVATTLLGKDSFQEAYIEGITMPITKHNYTVRRVEDLADTMRAAFRIAQSGRKGPVLVDIPKDITAASCEFTPKAPELIRTVTYYNEEDVKEAARLINESERLTRLSNDLLTLQHIEEGTDQVIMKRVNLHDVAERVADAMNPIFEENGAELKIEGEAPDVLGNPDRLQQVIYNLVANASRFVGKGGHVTIRLAGLADKSVISVIDDGPGFGDIDPKLLFTRFYRGDNSRARNTGGTGLGLSIVKGIVEGHDGTIEAFNAAGGGACFVVSLPSVHEHIH
mgnify:CR=1 FL=1